MDISKVSFVGEARSGEITHKQLLDAVCKVNAIIRNPEMIKRVRAKYTKGPVFSIEQDRRAEFIADILSLLPNAISNVRRLDFQRIDARHRSVAEGDFD